MRRITLWILSTVSALVLLFSYRTSTMGPGGSTTGGVALGLAGSGGAGTTHTGSTATGSGTVSSANGSGGNGTYDGAVADTMWGPVQVRIAVAGGRITDVGVIQVPNGNFRDQEINSYAVPILQQETLAAQSAQIDGVSGATVTSDGYRQSLQSAIDQAHLG